MVLMLLILWSLLCFLMQTVQESYFLTGNSTNLTLTTGTIPIECRAGLRFGKADVFLLLEVLRFPDKFVCSQKTVCSKLEGLCILLKRLAFPCRYIDMVSRFGRNPTELCLIFNTVLEFVYSSHHHRLESWNQPFLLPQVLERYAQIIHNRGAPLQNCFVFDGTLCRIARPQNNQSYLQWP